MGGGRRGRSPCCDKSKVKKGAWSPSEDTRLVSFIQKHGHPNWRSLPKQAGLLRCGKSCRLRWINYLRPDVKRGNFTPQEEDSIIRLHATFGNKWSKIASQLPGRTDNEIKNVWNTHLKKRSSSLLINTPPSSSSPANSYINNSNISYGIIDQQNQNMMMMMMMMRNDEETCSSSHNHQNPNKLGLIDKQDIQAAVDHQASTSTSCNNNVNADSHEDKISGEENENNNNVVEIVPLLESDDEFWNMLDDIELDDQSQPLMITDDDDDENGSQMEVDKWLRLLEEELGLISSASNSNSC